MPVKAKTKVTSGKKQPVRVAKVAVKGGKKKEITTTSRAVVPSKPVKKVEKAPAIKKVARIQTAEGWKREMQRKRQGVKKG